MRNVEIGALGLPSDGGSFTLTFLRFLDGNGKPVAGPIAPFVNPFPDPIQQLVIANNLHAGHYAIEISGSGNAITRFGGDVPDFTTRLLVTVPEPQMYAMLLAGMGLVGYAMRKRKQRAVAIA